MQYKFPQAPKGFVWVYRRYAYLDFSQRIYDAHEYGLEGFVVLERIF